MKITRPINILLQKFKCRREAAAAFSNRAQYPIIIYQMGKVGSSTVYQSLKDASLPNPVLHLHFLSDDISRHKTSLKQVGFNTYPYHIYLSDAVIPNLKRNRNFPIKLISLVRDPIAIIISDLFEVPAFAGNAISAGTNGIHPGKAMDYLHKKLEDPESFTYIYEWFDRELKTVFGIDVFETPFPVNKGYCEYSKNSVDALVIRLEDLSEKGPEAISTFLGLNTPLVLKQANVRSESSDHQSYREVVEGISLQRSLCEKIYSSRFVKHFYSETMINNFILKWTRA